MNGKRNNALAVLLITQSAIGARKIFSFRRWANQELNTVDLEIFRFGANRNYGQPVLEIFDGLFRGIRREVNRESALVSITDCLKIV